MDLLRRCRRRRPELLLQQGYPLSGTIRQVGHRREGFAWIPSTEVFPGSTNLVVPEDWQRRRRDRGNLPQQDAAILGRHRQGLAARGEGQAIAAPVGSISRRLPVE